MERLKGQELENHMRTLIEAFNFQKIQEIMERLDWRYLSNGGRVPTVADLKKKAREVMTACAEHGVASARSGGFFAAHRRNESGQRYILLSFELEQHNSLEG